MRQKRFFPLFDKLLDRTFFFERQLSRLFHSQFLRVSHSLRYQTLLHPQCFLDSQQLVGKTLCAGGYPILSNYLLFLLFEYIELEVGFVHGGVG